MPAARRPTARGWRRDALPAFVAALVMLAVHAAGGFQTLQSAGGDNDSLLRLVEVRDLLGGQGWFDLMQYRMGPQGGFLMHWSRLVDGPLAALVMLGTALTGSAAAGEVLALVAWPFLLSVAAMALLLRLARMFGGNRAVLPAAIVGAAALHFTGVFAPGCIDHHNVQLVLALAVAVMLADGGARSALVAGIGSSLMLAVGMESAPYVAVAGLWAAGHFLFRGERSAPAAFGIGFAATAAACLAVTVAPSRWGVAECDAFSLPQFALAGIGGVGLALAALLPSTAWWMRLGWLAVIGIAAGAVAVAFFPQCLSAPFADLDPRLKTYWLNSVTEALPVWTIVATRPVMIFGYYATPLLGALLLALRLTRGGIRRVDLVVAAFLGMAVLVSFWQVRGSMFAIPLAVVPLSAWIAAAREAAARRQSGAALHMALAWLLSVNLVWAGGARAAAQQLGLAEPVPAPGVAGGPCYTAADYAQLAALPPTTVLAVSNLGAPILRYTQHRALAGPYHRNVAGNLLALDALMGNPETAAAALRANGVTLLAHCRGNSESGVLAGWAPDGLMAALLAGKPPAWLEPVSGGGDLVLYRVR
ncbi:MAG: GtrA family protein [Rhizobiaceae bacterium]